MEKMLCTAAAAAVGMAVGAAVTCTCMQDRRQLRRTVHRMAKGAEQTMKDIDRFMQDTLG